MTALSRIGGLACVAGSALAALITLPVSAQVPSYAVFGCDAPGAAWRSGSGGTYNNALIVTYNPPPSSGVYGPQQGDLAVFSQAGGYSGAFRCGEAADNLNFFAQNANVFSGYVFNLDLASPTPRICYVPAGIPCQARQAEHVMFLQMRRTTPREAFQRFTTNMNLIRTARGSMPVLD